MSAKGESWVKEEAQNNYFALLIWLALATVHLKNAKKACSVGYHFLRLRRQSNLPLNNSHTNGISHHFK